MSQEWLTEEQLKRRQRKERPLPAFLPDGAADPALILQTQEERRETRAALDAALQHAGLSQRERTVYVLALAYEMSQEEVAFVLGSARTTVRRQLAEAKAKMGVRC